MLDKYEIHTQTFSLATLTTSACFSSRNWNPVRQSQYLSNTFFLLLPQEAYHSQASLVTGPMIGPPKLSSRSSESSSVWCNSPHMDTAWLSSSSWGLSNVRTVGSTQMFDKARFLLDTNSRIQEMGLFLRFWEMGSRAIWGLPGTVNRPDLYSSPVEAWAAAT